MNLQDGAEIATGDLRKGAQRDVNAGNNNKNAWGGGNKKGNKMGAVEVSAPSRWGGASWNSVDPRLGKLYGFK